MYLNKRIVQAIIKKIPPIGVAGANHFKLKLIIDCNERKKILKEKRKVISRNTIQYLRKVKARLWY